MTKKDSIVHGKKRTGLTITLGSQREVIAREQPDVTSSSGKVVQRGHKVDIVFVFDTTGSMSDKIRGLVNACKTLVNETEALDLDAQFSLISFGDTKVQGGGDSIDIVVSPTGDIEKIKHGLTNIPRNNGFANIGESAFEAVQLALKLEYRKDAVKVMILLTDDEAHQHNISAIDMIRVLQKREFLVFVIATESQYYKDMGKSTGGDWLKVSSSTDVAGIIARFKAMAKKATTVAKKVHALGGGSVKKYLQLNPPE